MDPLVVLDWDDLEQGNWVSFLLDDEFRIQRYSKLAAKHGVAPVPGTPLTDVFDFVRPPRIRHAADLRRHLGELIIAAPKSGYLAVRGQMRRVRGSDMLVLAGSPWLSWIREHHPEVSLGFADFPPSDAQIDLLFVLSSERQHLRDLQELTGALEAARQSVMEASRQQSELFAMMSHEMRTPLAGIISALHLMSTESLPQVELDLLRSARSSSRNLLGVINQVLDYSKYESGAFKVEPAPFRPLDLVNSVRELLATRAELKALDLVFHVDPGVPDTLAGDDRLICQVLVNLANNAVKFTQQGWVRVEVGGRLLDDGQFLLQFAVSDSGPGIAVAEHDRLFQKYWTAHASRPSDLPSTGLGLYTAQRIVAALGGSIGFDPAHAPGCRFWFEVTLPVAQTQAALPAADPASPADSSSMFAGTVLLADDNLTNQLLCKLTLERMGMDVVLAGDGIEVIEALDRSPVDVLLLDLNMPVLDGFETVKRLRADSRFQRMPIVALTAHTGTEYRRKALEHGFDEYLSKPASQADLHAMLGRWLRAESRRPAEGGSGSVTRSSVAVAPVLDPEVIGQLIRDVGGHAATVFRLIVSEIPRRIEAIEEALQNMDLTRIAGETHSMKSSSASFGAREFADCCAALEAAARDGDRPRVLTLAGRLQELAPALVEALEAAATSVQRGA